MQSGMFSNIRHENGTTSHRRNASLECIKMERFSSWNMLSGQKAKHIASPRLDTVSARVCEYINETRGQNAMSSDICLGFVLCVKTYQIIV